MIYAVAYVLAIVAANVGVSIFGPWSAPIVAFLLIGAVLTLRDKLHDIYGPRIVMYLIVLGTVISLFLGGNVARIALAGALAFTVSELADTGVYHMLRNLPWIKRVNASNLVGAAVDSAIFPSLAFGGFPIAIILLQFAAKTAGGALWAYLIWRYSHHLTSTR